MAVEAEEAEGVAGAARSALEKARDRLDDAREQLRAAEEDAADGRDTEGKI